MNIPFRKKKHPFFLLTIALGIIYPNLWGVFLSLSRYFHLGTSHNLIYLLTKGLDYIIFAIFILPYLFVWGYMMINFVKQIKKILWQYIQNH